MTRFSLIIEYISVLVHVSVNEQIAETTSFLLQLYK